MLLAAQAAALVLTLAMRQLAAALVQPAKATPVAMEPQDRVIRPVAAVAVQGLLVLVARQAVFVWRPVQSALVAATVARA